MATVYWQMTPTTYGDYFEILGDAMDAEAAGDGATLEQLAERLQQLPGYPPHDPADRLVPVVVGPKSQLTLRKATSKPSLRKATPKPRRER